MATKEDRPGLLAKMAKFVRNPTKDWAELDRSEPVQESGYDKQALKAMIERKRQNDFVRKREFDQLRKLRKRDPTTVAGVARPSFFQSSISTDQDGRAVTLKKIDEIEAQMSKQWWKGRQEAAAQSVKLATPMPGNEGAPSLDTLPSEQLSSQALSPSVSAEQYESTASAQMRSTADASTVPPGEDVATQMADGAAPLGHARHAVYVHDGGRDGLSSVPGAYASGDLAFSTSKLFAMDVDEMATDAELEEAAIRFANGDNAGAEASLLQALAGEAGSPEIATAWAAALLDLYRATGQQDKFDRAVVDYAPFWGDSIPTWVALADIPEGAPTTMAAPMAAAKSSFSVLAEPDPQAIWNCPACLDVEAMESLREVLSTQPLPWHLGWACLQQITPEAMPLLGGLFASLCNEPVSLSFSGADALVRALRNITPSGDRSVDPGWWLVHLNVLRTMQWLDEFELVALDYCVTFEVSPPAWEPARCEFSGALGGGASSAGSENGFSHTAPQSTVVGLDASFSNRLELRGEVLGDATQALTALDESRTTGDNIVVSCKGLLRVDFSAAGSILNWVAMRQAEGSIVQFRDVQRLVAAFFNVIGINEHARVVPRRL
jgi:STAS domain